MGFVTVATVGGFVLVASTTSAILTAKDRNDLANLLDMLVKLALTGLFAYVLFKAIITLVVMFGGLPRV